MTDKAYIVANKEQELYVLKKLEQDGRVWLPGDNPTDWLPSESLSFENFPYTLIERGYITWSSNLRNKDRKIVYDGINEEKMNNNYKVTQEFMNELIKWRDDECIDATSGKNFNYINDNDLDELPAVAEGWWVYDNDPIERNNRLIAIIQWLNGEDVFEVEAPHKFVVRNDTPDYDGDYYYVQSFDGVTNRAFALEGATKFDTREEAQEWSNSHQVVVEIDAEGNEVE